MDKLLSILQEKMDEEVFTEEVKTQLKDEFEVLVSEKVSKRVKTLREEFEKELTEKAAADLKEFKEEMTDNLDQYLTYCAENFFEENKVPYQSKFKVELSESILSGVRGVLEQYQVEVPKAKADVIEDLKEDVAKSEKIIADLTKKINESQKQQFEYEKALVLQSMMESAELTGPQRKNTIKLLEDLDFEDIESFKRKATICIEKSSVNEEDVIEEEKEEDGHLLDEQKAEDEEGIKESAQILSSLLPKS